MDNLTPDQRFAQLNLTLPPAPTPLGVYKPFLIIDKFVYVSGHGTVKEDRSLIIGKVGIDFNADEAKLAAQKANVDRLEAGLLPEEVAQVQARMDRLSSKVEMLVAGASADTMYTSPKSWRKPKSTSVSDDTSSAARFVPDS